MADRTSILFNRAPIEGTVNLSITNISAKQRVYNDYQIIEWDMSNVLNWDESIIEQIRIDLIDSTYFSTYGTNKFDIDWVEIGGLQADKYIDGVLKVPLRTEKSKRRTRGTWAKVKYSARTTDKFNIFAILAKYRKTY